MANGNRFAGASPLMAGLGAGLQGLPPIIMFLLQMMEERKARGARTALEEKRLGIEGERLGVERERTAAQTAIEQERLGVERQRRESEERLGRAKLFTEQVPEGLFIDPQKAEELTSGRFGGEFTPGSGIMAAASALEPTTLPMQRQELLTRGAGALSEAYKGGPGTTVPFEGGFAYRKPVPRTEVVNILGGDEDNLRQVRLLQNYTEDYGRRREVFVNQEIQNFRARNRYGEFLTPDQQRQADIYAERMRQEYDRGNPAEYSAYQQALKKSMGLLGIDVSIPPESGPQPGIGRRMTPEELRQLIRGIP